MHNGLTRILIVLSILLVGCSKGPQADGLLGTTWVPVHAMGMINGPGYTVSWDDDIDENGVLVVQYERNGSIIDYEMNFSGYKFYSDKTEKMYITFSPAKPGTTSAPRRYYLQDSRIYLEKSASSGDPWSSSMSENTSETRFVSSLLVEFSADKMTFDGVTYRRKE